MTLEQTRERNEAILALSKAYNACILEVVKARIGGRKTSDLFDARIMLRHRAIDIAATLLDGRLPPRDWWVSETEQHPYTLSLLDQLGLPR